MTCKKELIASGAASVPRTCQKCRLGPCTKGHDRPVFKNADVAYAGRRNGMNEADENGAYIALTVDGNNVKFSVSQAQAIAADIIAAT